MAGHRERHLQADQLSGWAGPAVAALGAGHPQVRGQGAAVDYVGFHGGLGPDLPSEPGIFPPALQSRSAEPDGRRKKPRAPARHTAWYQEDVPIEAGRTVWRSQTLSRNRNPTNLTLTLTPTLALNPDRVKPSCRRRSKSRASRSWMTSPAAPGPTGPPIASTPSSGSSSCPHPNQSV